MRVQKVLRLGAQDQFRSCSRTCCYADLDARDALLLFSFSFLTVYSRRCGCVSDFGLRTELVSSCSSDVELSSDSETEKGSKSDPEEPSLQSPLHYPRSSQHARPSQKYHLHRATSPRTHPFKQRREFLNEQSRTYRYVSNHAGRSRGHVQVRHVPACPLVATRDTAARGCVAPSAATERECVSRHEIRKGVCCLEASTVCRCTARSTDSKVFVSRAGIKYQHLSATVSHMQLSWTSGVLVAVDSLSQLFLFRLSPVTEPGNPISPSYTVILLEHCLMTGTDWWDVLLGLRPAVMSGREVIANLDKVLLHLETKEFSVEPLILQSLQQLTQWVADLTLHLMASLPQQVYNHMRFPGGGLIADPKSLNMLRELLVIFRMWGFISESCLPAYTKMTGVASPALFLNSLPLPFEFGIQPDFLHIPSKLHAVEGSVAMPSKMDIVRHIALGSNPSAARHCTRCFSISMVRPGVKAGTIRAWEQRWVRFCPCGGQWRLVM
ncbi:hypothetical protein HPB47_018897 [Ixodes persulcatus]|uniref:Uncharacterized protein n=1 Tax=Ixodes persulcatus TaxID=34615 RepID=A0AC60QLH9_IXOPE|nr:hypothetical protein HPB47_018897 [Ixodes persulcatus]